MTNTTRELAKLQRMEPAELRAKHLKVFGEAMRTGNKAYLVKRIAWRLQAIAEGNLSERAKKRAAELANDADIRTTVPRSPKLNPQIGQSTVIGRLGPPGGPKLPVPGTLLTRHYKGRAIQVTVLANGFDFEGTIYKSLSAVAKMVTGSHWNGHLFFGLRNGGRL